MKTSCSFTKDNLKSFFRPGWKDMGDPGVEEVETRICVKPERGCGAVYLPCLRRFYALFLIIIQWNSCFLINRFSQQGDNILSIEKRTYHLFLFSFQRK